MMVWRAPISCAAMAHASATAAHLAARKASYMAFYNLVLTGQGHAALVAAREHLKT